LAEEHQRGSRLELTTGRIQALVDGIFGFSMTLLVVNLTIPKGLSSGELGATLSGQGRNFYAYALSFLLLATFWVAQHRQSHYFRRSDSRHVWITILMLLFVALMPFSTSLLANYAGTEIAGLVFGGNLTVLGLVSAANWLYATSRRRLVSPDLDQHIVNSDLTRSLVVSGVSATSMVVSVFYAQGSGWVYLVIPVLLVALRARRK